MLHNALNISIAYLIQLICVAGNTINGFEQKLSMQYFLTIWSNVAFI